MAEDRKKEECAGDASEKASSQLSSPRWGLTTYRVKCTLFNTLTCRSEIVHTDLKEAAREAERLVSDHGEIASLVRITAEKDLVYVPD